jgi:16S rRNA C967 or C1407 C5-methylase (RsmB/RsmF family)
VKRRKRRIRIEFDEFYQELFGHRWPDLRRSLLAEGDTVELSAGLLAPYFLDRASVLAGQALEVKPGHRVLDLCAAPGGKSLVLALALGGRGELVANDRSSARRARLRAVLDGHLPEALRKTVRVRGHDAAKWGMREPHAYDRVLVDVPCSSEAHVLRSPRHMAEWSPARTKHLAVQAYSFAVSALSALRPQGIMVYATCALSPAENDGVIRRLVGKYGARFDVLDTGIPHGEPTELGRILLPDTAEGMGPLFVCRIRKRKAEPWPRQLSSTKKNT